MPNNFLIPVFCTGIINEAVKGYVMEVISMTRVGMRLLEKGHVEGQCRCHSFMGRT